MARSRSAKTQTDELAQFFAHSSSAANEAGRALHDDVGPSLSAVGLHLQLLRLDHPAAAGEIDKINGILDQAYERIRAVSQALTPSPVLRGGLSSALERLAETCAAEDPALIVRASYNVNVVLPAEPACALYDAAVAAVAAARIAGATRLSITVSGARSVDVRISDDGRAAGRTKRLDAARRIAQARGLLMTVTTKRSTIVLIRYALRRTAGG